MTTTDKVAPLSNVTNASQPEKDTQGGTTVSNPRANVYQKSIQYDRDTRDYAMYLDGELVGFARNHHEAEVTLDRLVFELMTGQYFRDAA